MIFESTRGIHRISCKSADFPRFLVDISIDDDVFLVNEALGKALLEFMTSPVAAPTLFGNASTPVSKAKPLFITLRLLFAQCSLTRDSLEIIERLLDRVFARKARQYALTNARFHRNPYKYRKLGGCYEEQQRVSGGGAQNGLD